MEVARRYLEPEFLTLSCLIGFAEVVAQVSHSVAAIGSDGDVQHVSVAFGAGLGVGNQLFVRVHFLGDAER